MENRIETLCSYLEKDFHLPFSIDEAARNLGISPSRLQHLFKENKGCSITQYLRELRIKKAAELLVSTTLSVKEIYVSVGIYDAAHFSADFKKTFDLTPSAYRKKFFNFELAKGSLKHKIAKSANK